MSTPKKQHFIPQFLLRNFAEGRPNKERLWTFDKRRGISYPASVGDTAHENRFYEGRSSDGAEIKAEGLTQYVDGMGADVVRDVVERRQLPLTGLPFVALSYFVAAQMYRVPLVRNEMDFIRRVIIQKWGPEVRAMDDDRGVGDYSEADTKFASISSFVEEVPGIARLLQGKVWFLATARNSSFVLSDNPVVKHNHIDYWPRGSLGLSQVGIEINFPISPDLALQILCPKIAEEIHVTPEGYNMLVRQKKGIPVFFEKENVEFVNSLQVIRSERFIYAQREEHLEIAREMLVAHPDLAKPASEKIVSDDQLATPPLQ